MQPGSRAREAGGDCTPRIVGGCEHPAVAFCGWRGTVWTSPDSWPGDVFLAALDCDSNSNARPATKMPAEKAARRPAWASAQGEAADGDNQKGAGCQLSTVNLRRFSEPDVLREFAPRTLVALLDEHRGFLAGKDVALPPVGEEAEPDYEALARVFASPDDIPPGLVERFHLVKQMGHPEQMDRILDAVAKRQLELTLSPESSPVDVAAELLLRHEGLFQELHAERAVARYRAFTYFVARRKRVGWRPPESVAGVEARLNSWYEAHHRGRSAKLFWRQHGEEFWFYVRHAEPIKREGSVDVRDQSSRSQIYRPERHDVAVYDATAGELRVHADSDAETDLFRLVFGLELFKDGSYFPACQHKYSLDVLRRRGRAALACAGIDGLLAITLREVEIVGRGEMASRERISAPDVFSLFEQRGTPIPPEAEIRMARFAVMFRDARKPRSFTIRPSNHAWFSRDDDAVPLQAWLKRQEFVVGERTEGNADEPWQLEGA